MAESIYDIAMRLSVEDAATSALVQIARAVARLGDAANEAAERLTKLGETTAATFADLRSLGYYLGAGSLAIGAGMLGAVDMIANRYEGLHEQIMRLNEAGLTQVQVQRAVGAAMAQTAAMPLTTPAQNLALYNRLTAMTGSPEAAIQLLGPTARTAAVFGERGAESMIQLGETLGLSTESQRQQFLQMQDFMTRAFLASGRTATPDMMLNTVRRMGAAGMGMTPEALMPLLGLAQISGGAGGGFGAAMSNVGAGIASGLQKLEKLPDELSKGKAPPWVYDVFGGPSGLPPHMLRQAATNPYEFMQTVLGPALLQRFGADPARIAAELSQIMGGQAAAAPWMRMLTEGRVWPRRPGEEAPLESWQRRARGAMSAEEAVQARLTQDPEAIRKAIGNMFEAIVDQIGEPASKIKVALETNVLAGLLKLYGFLDDPAHKESIERWTKMFASFGVILTGLGLGTLLTTLAFTPVGGAIAILGALSALIASLAEHPEVAKAMTEMQEKGLSPETAKALASAFWTAFWDSWQEGDKAMQANMAAAVQGMKSFFSGESELAKQFDQWAATNISAPLNRWLHSTTILDAVTAWVGRLLAALGPLGRFFVPGQYPESVPGATGPLRGGVEPQSGGHWEQLGRRPVWRPNALTAQPPGLPGGPSGQAVTPPPERMGASQSDLEAATRNAIWSAPAKDARPIVVSLNIDGRRISEAISTQLAGMLGVPGQAPFHDAWRGWAPPDSQYSTT
jgi:hypothetical protein